jgi:phosphatidylglycerol:prolipoprotein diacylglycerol transferase
MELFPNTQTAIIIGPLSITWYAILVLTGFLVAYLLSKHNFKKAGYDPKIVTDLLFGILIFGVIGTRVWFILFSDPAWYFADITRIFRGDGLAIQGGLIFGAAYSYYFARKHKINFLHLADMVLPNVLIAQAIGRWGNFLNQEAYGRIVSENFYRFFPDFFSDLMFINGAYREPTFLYESITNVLGWVLIVLVIKRLKFIKRGDLMASYLIWYGATRFVIEGFRVDNLMFMGLRMSQIISIAFIALGLLGIFGLYRKLLPSKPVILFDFDGTIADTEVMIIESIKHLFKKYRPDYQVTREDELFFIGPSLPETLGHYFDQDIDKLITEYRNYNKKLHETMLKEMDGTTELLKYLKSEGYTLGIVSSKINSAVRMGCKVLKIENYFDVVIGLDDVEIPKPDPTGIYKACQKLNYGHDSVIYVGDSVSDIIAGQNANAYTIGYVFNEDRKQALIDSKPNKVITHLLEIKDILKENNVWTNNSM